MEERTVRNRLLHQFTALGQVGFLREPASGRGGNVIAAPPSCRLTHVAPHTLLIRGPACLLLRDSGTRAAGERAQARARASVPTVPPQHRRHHHQHRHRWRVRGARAEACARPGRLHCARAPTPRGPRLRCARRRQAGGARGGRGEARLEARWPPLETGAGRGSAPLGLSSVAPPSQPAVPGGSEEAGGAGARGGSGPGGGRGRRCLSGCWFRERPEEVPGAPGAWQPPPSGAGVTGSQRPPWGGARGGGCAVHRRGCGLSFPFFTDGLTLG